MVSEAKLLEVLRKIAKDHGYDENDRSIDLKPFSAGAASFTCLLFSVILSSSGKDDLKLFCKVATLGEEVRSVSPIQIYEVETIFYSKILPQFKYLENRHNIPKLHRLVISEYYVGKIEYGEELLVLEDLTAKGFQRLNKSEYIDWNYASACVEALAKYQALSVAFERDDPQAYGEIIAKLKLNSCRNYVVDFANRSIVTAIESTDEIYRSRVEIFLRNGMRSQVFFKFFNPERKVLLVHGDFRASNILHKVDQNGKLQVALLDYQFVKQGNPVTDLLHFLVCGSDEVFRAKHFHQFFDHYYETFSQALQRLGIDPDTVYTEKEFRDDVKEMLPLALYIAAYMLVFITGEESQLPQVEDGFNLEQVEITNEQYKKRFNGLVRDYVTWGIL